MTFILLLVFLMLIRDHDDRYCPSPPLTAVVLQVSHLQELVREGEQNLGSAQTQIGCLRETQEKLKIELDATRSRVRETSNLLTDLQVNPGLSEPKMIQHMPCFSPLLATFL